MKTLIIASDNCLNRVLPVTVNLFIVEHWEKTDPIVAIKGAFRKWAATEEGMQFIEDNGQNWGDSLDIPKEILANHGITLMAESLRDDADNGSSMGAGMTADELESPWDDEAVVDHNEHLVE